MKINKITYFLTFVVLMSICMVSFNSTFKLIKQSSIVVVDEEIEDTEVEDDEFEKDDKIVYDKVSFLTIDSYNTSILWQNFNSDLYSIEIKIDSPPPKV